VHATCRKSALVGVPVSSKLKSTGLILLSLRLVGGGFWGGGVLGKGGSGEGGGLCMEDGYTVRDQV
jgi:hypothetical protein